MEASSPAKIDRPVPESGRRRWFFLGVFLGAFLGIGPAYYLVATFTAEVMPALVVPATDSAASTRHAGSQLGPACAELAEKAALLPSLIARRHRALTSLAVHLGAGWARRSVLEPSGPDKNRYFAGFPFRENKTYTEFFHRLAGTWERERTRQAEFWDLLADTRMTLPRCEQLQPRGGGAREQADARFFDAVRGEELAEAVRSQTARLRVALDGPSDLPHPAELVARNLSASKDGENERPQTGRIPSQAYYVDWQDKWIYAVGGVTAPPSPQDFVGLDSYRLAVGQARASLLEGMMSVRVDPERLVRDLVAGNPRLREKLLQLVHAIEVSTYRRSENRAVWVEIRLPLAGSGGLMPLVLPFNASRQSDELDTKGIASQDASAPDTEQDAANQPYTAVVLDARGIPLEPALLPPVRTQSGRVLLDVDQWDLNEVAAHGLCTYTPYSGSAKLQAGSNFLWLKLLGSERPGVLVVGDSDGAQLRTAQMSGRLPAVPLTVLTD